MKITQTKQSHKQQPWLIDVSQAGTRLVRVNFSFGGNRYPNTFTSAVRPLSNALNDLVQKHGLTIYTADLRPWYKYFGPVGAINGYIAVRSDLSDADLLRKIEDGFSQICRLTRKRRFSICIGTPNQMPLPPKKLFPFQFDTEINKPDRYSDPHIIQMVDGQLLETINVTKKWRKTHIQKMATQAKIS